MTGIPYSYSVMLMQSMVNLDSTSSGRAMLRLH
jgi:hypothetical protein